MIKKGLVIVIIGLLLLSIPTSCQNEAEISDGDNQGDTEGVNENGLSKDIEVIIDKNTNQARIVSNRDNNSISSIFQVQWINNEEVIFNNKTGNETDEVNIFYTFNTNNNNLEKRFDVEERIWDGHVVNGGKSLIYSSDAFNGLYSLSENGAIEKIAKELGWYQISPDKAKIIINGISEGQNNDEEFKRYLYDIDTKTLVELSDIDDMSYGFFKIAANWSPDSIHVVSQNGDSGNSLSIINVIENKTVEKIKIQDAIIPPFPAWSPDGKKLAFMVQSKGNREHTYDDGHMYVYMTDKIGIYNIEDSSVKFYNLGEKLTIDNRILWQDNGQGVIVQTINRDYVDAFLSEETPEGEILPVSFDYIDSDSNKDVLTTLRDNIKKLGGSYEHNKYLFGLFNDRILVYTEIMDEQYIINFLNIDNSSLIQLKDCGGHLKRIHKSEEGLYIVTLDGIFFIDNNLEYDMILDFAPYMTDEVIGVDGFLSPDFTKAAIQVECDPTSVQKDFIEIIKLLR